MIRMKKHDEKCPICGEVNKSLLLEETDGWFVCDKCGNEVQLVQYMKIARLPLYDMKSLVAAFKK